MIVIATPSRCHLTSQPPTLPQHLLPQDMTQGICHSSSNTQFFFFGACYSLCLQRPPQILCLTNPYSSVKAQAKVTFSTRPLPDSPSKGSLLVPALCCCGTDPSDSGSTQVQGSVSPIAGGQLPVGKGSHFIVLETHTQYLR